MAKKKKGKIVNMLSPENYIRERVRSLPVYECLVNDEWNDSKMANVIVARKHTNGNITSGIYMVDLMCLGVKESFWIFNEPEFNYKERKAEWREEIKLKNIDYSLAHNIIYAGIEFAEDYGFRPHKNFSSVSRFILEEEDSGDIEFIDIKCGMNGKPSYVTGPNDNEHKKAQILEQLEKTAGPGNYYYTDMLNDLDDDDWDEKEFDEEDYNDLLDYEDEFEEEDEEEETLYELPDKELYGELKRLFNNQREPSLKEFSMMLKISDILFNRMADPDQVDIFYDEFSDSLEKIRVLTDEIPDEMLGIKVEDHVITDEMKEKFINILEIPTEKIRKRKNQIKKFKNSAGEIPASFYLDLIIWNDDPNNHYFETAKKYAKKFPDYPFLQLRYLIQKLGFENNDIEELNIRPFDPESFFNGRTSLHRYEISDYLLYQFLLMKAEDNISKIVALESVLTDSEIMFDLMNTMLPAMAMYKMVYMTEKI